MKNARECFRFENGYYTYTKKYDGVHGVAFAFDEFDAAMMLGEEIPGEKLVSEYLKVSAGNDSSQKIHAIISLARLGGERALSRIIELTTDRDDDVRSIAIDCLGSFPAERRALDTLMALLKDKSLAVRKASAAALGRLGREEALDTLRQELSKYLASRRLWKKGKKHQGNDVADFVLSLFRALLELGANSVLSEIDPFLVHPEPEIVKKAAQVLLEHRAEIPREILRYVKKCNEYGILDNISSSVPNYSDMKGWRDNLYSRDRRARTQAARHLEAYRGSEGRAILREYLEKGKDLEIRMFVLECLRVRTIEQEQLISLLRKAIAHQWPSVRLRAARQLQLLPPAEWRKLAEEALQDEPDPLIRRALQLSISRADSEAEKQAAGQKRITGEVEDKLNYSARIPADQFGRTISIPGIMFVSKCIQLEESIQHEESLLKLKCSFCRRDQHQVERLIMKHRDSKLIAGPNVGICDSCLAALNEIIERNAQDPPVAREGDKFQGKCSFCDRQIYQKKNLLFGPGVKICIECLKLCNMVFKDKSGDNEARDKTEGDFEGDE